MSRPETRITRPSGLKQSQNGAYIYINCTVTGKYAFFTPERLTKALVKYGNDENRLAREYVTREVTDLREEGKSDEEIRAILCSPSGNAPKQKKAGRPPKVRTVEIVEGSVDEIKPAEEIVQEEGKEAVINEKEPKKVTYPWQSDPDYFKTPGGHTPVNIEEASKDSCFYPPRYLDDECAGCIIYSRCNCNLKITDEMRSGKKKEKPKIKEIKYE
jgi:hypothetical protein